MRAIQPVHLHDTGAKVSNLQKGLLFLILNQSGISDNDRKTLQRRLAPELREQTFGKATEDLVGIWQGQLKRRRDLPEELKNKVKTLPIGQNDQGNGDVDKVTAEALNWLLRKLGALQPE